MTADIKDTKHNSGWLSPEGTWYPCSPFGHLSLVRELHEEGITEKDDEEHIEGLGWTKIKGGRIFYFSYLEPKKGLVDAIFDFMTARGMEKTQMNGDRITLKEIVDLEWPLAMWKEF